MTIGGNRGKAIKAGGAGGSFDRSDLAWLATNGTLLADPGLPPPTGGASGNPEGLTASGGYISDWASAPGDVYRTHIFANSGTFEVTASGSHGNNLEFLVVAGGGGGAYESGPSGGGRGGGGGGGLRTNAAPAHPENMPSTALVYPGSGTWTCPITVGAGGREGYNQPGANGSNSSITNPSPNPNITASGGGYGAHSPGTNGGNGGSGGGGNYGSTGGSSSAAPDGSPTDQGNGGASGPNGGGGGGGAGGAGQDNQVGDAGGPGGLGVAVAIAGPPTNSPIGADGPDGGNNWFAGGGGGGGGWPGNAVPGGMGGAGPIPYPIAPLPASLNPGTPQCGGGNGNNGIFNPDLDAQSGRYGTGGGGGGGCANSLHYGLNGRGGKGGSGIVAIKYKIGTVAPTAKATGGTITYDASGGLGNERWVHTFFKSDSFVTTEAIPSAEYLIIAGGGAGGGAAPYSYTEGGGGGAGGFKTNQPGNPYAPHGSAIAFASPSPYAVVVGAGGVGKTGAGPANTASTPGSNSSLVHSTGTITAAGGGRGGGSPPSNSGRNGGSAGGGGGDTGPGGTATPSNQGNDGGAQGGGGPNNYYSGGGGGGAGSTGWDGGAPALNDQGKGGNGLASTISGTSITYAGGGSGGALDGTAHPPSPGGGGVGGNNAADNGTSALQNTGSGGGGGTTPDAATSGSGGSGIVVIAYPAS